MKQDPCNWELLLEWEEMVNRYCEEEAPSLKIQPRE